MFKAEQDMTTADPEFMSVNPGSNIQDSTSESGTSAGKDAKQILTGTVITNCLFKTSPGAGRIELTTTLDPTTFTYVVPAAFLGLDTFVVYDELGNDANVLINRNGIWTTYILGVAATIVTAGITTANITTTNTAHLALAGHTEPQIWMASIKYDGTAHFIPGTWIITYLGPGAYRVTHNFNSTAYTVNVTDHAEAGGPATLIVYTIDNVGLNSFDVLAFDYLGTGAIDASFFLTVAKVV